ncbi:MAG TPA: plastocyanin/azurin family copper-binding protein [Oligoflexus sp.]|uniref:cupredoxin domain-containing protein n=1 Tax=Oligoflexus sp. TaxID=1971216 RepID=UPI002D398A81|nr:plastocyanin/azurin family copper-binding protein [Oligoflexus sp.]HYX31978.1 plastocyanin/azurin family copper-binding protein [Oligoflexus sp.]
MFQGIIWALIVGFTPFTLLGKDHIVTQKGKQFSQTDLQIAPGDTIVFKNDDDTIHNVFTASEAIKFNLGVQKAGTELRREFATAGEAEIRCAIHPKMKLKIVVKK